MTCNKRERQYSDKGVKGYQRQGKDEGRLPGGGRFRAVTGKEEVGGPPSRVHSMNRGLEMRQYLS